MERAGLYVAVVGDPGSAKTPAMNLVLKPLYDEQVRLHADHAAAVQEYKAAQDASGQAADAGAAGGHGPPPPLRHLYVNDATTEAVGALLARNPKGLLVTRDELSGWVKSMDMYRQAKGTDAQFYLSAWSGVPIKIDRRQQLDNPLVVPHPFVSVLGGVQPDVLPELDSSHGKQDGFLARLLFAYPAAVATPRWSDAEVTAADQEPWRRAVARLIELPLADGEDGRRPLELAMSPLARDAYAAWYDAAAADMDAPNFPPALKAPGIKMRAYVARFALVLYLMRAACEGAADDPIEGVVDEDDIRRAVEVAAYFMAHARAVYPCLARTADDQKTEALVAWMDRKGMAECDARTAMRSNVAGVKTTSEADKLFRDAADRGLGELRTAPAVTGKAGVRAVRFVRASASGVPDTPDTPDTPGVRSAA